MDKPTQDAYRRCISILIEMKRNLIEYKKVRKISTTYCFLLSELDSTNNLKQVLFEYNVETDKYQITTIFDGTELTNAVPADDYPIQNVISLLEVFQDVRTFWIAFENFWEQQQEILSEIPSEYIEERLVKYLERNKATIYSAGRKYDIPAGATMIENVGISEFLVKNNISYLDVYSSVFFNINDY